MRSASSAARGLVSCRPRAEAMASANEASSTLDTISTFIAAAALGMARSMSSQSLRL